MPNNSSPDNGADPGEGGHRWKKVTAVIGTTTALVTLAAAVVAFSQARPDSDSPKITITAPDTGAGATASPCPMVRGTARLAEGMTLLVAVRRTTGMPRARTARFYRVDTLRPSGEWNVPVSLEGEDSKMAGQWYSISALSVDVDWADFLEKLDGTADGPLMAAPAMPPHEGEAPSIDVQREAGQGFC